MTIAREQPKSETPAEATEKAHSRAARLWEVDALRGIAILMMVVYHFTYDLDQFGDFSIGASSGNWQRFANLTATMFILLVGVSLVLSYTRSVQRVDDEWDLVQKYMLRGLRIFGYGMVITVAVMFFAPQGAIIFGILHLIGVSIICAYPFLRWPMLAFPVGIALVVLGYFMGYPQVDFPWLIWLGFRPEGIGSMFDYRPMIPWFGVALLGIFIGHVLYNGGKRRFRLPDIGGWAPVRGLSKMGQYSLGIYLIHQPVILVVLELTGVIDLGLF